MKKSKQLQHSKIKGNTILNEVINEIIIDFEIEKFSFYSLAKRCESSIEETKILLLDYVKNGVIIVQKKRAHNDLWFNINRNLLNETNLKPSIEKLIDAFTIWTFHDKKNDWREFVKITDRYYSKLPICSVISNYRLDNSDTTLLLKLMIAFSNGEHPVFMSHLFGSAEQMAKVSFEIMNNKNKLVKNNLINFEVERDQVSLRLTISPTTLQHFYSEKIETSVHNPTFANLIDAKEIDSIALSYNQIDEQFFNDMTQLGLCKEQNQALTILLHGETGTGKTLFAKQLVKKLNGKLYQLNFPKIQSKWIGETQKNIQKAFEEYEKIRLKSKVPIVLLINEADGLMNKRVTIHNSNDIFSNQVQTEFLERLENFKGILIATSNLFNHFDEAFYRRFLFKHEIQRPSIDVRKKTIENWKFKHLIREIEEVLAQNWTLAQLNNIEQKLSLINSIREITKDDFMNIFANELNLSVIAKKIGF
jgi:adenylate kinase family enzyme